LTRLQNVATKLTAAERAATRESAKNLKPIELH
jgi:hypothetical protein